MKITKEGNFVVQALVENQDLSVLGANANAKMVLKKVTGIETAYLKGTVVQDASLNGVFPNATFSRASTAYMPDGTSVASGVPRYVNGRYQNLLTANQSSIETDVTGLAGNTGPDFTATRDATTAKFGVASLKGVATTASDHYIELPGPQANGSWAVYPVTPGKTYTFSSYCCSIDGVAFGRVRIVGITEAGGVVGDLTGNSVSSTDWTGRSVLTYTAPSNVTGVLLRFQFSTVGTVWFDGAQWEEGSTATDWRVGGSGKGVLIEEDTTNLLTVNQSDVETDLTGLSVWQASGVPTLVRDTTDKWRGTASAKATAAIAGMMTITTTPRTAITSGQSYTFSVYTKATVLVGKQCAVVCYWFDSIGTYMNQSMASVGINASSTWTRLVASGTAPAGAVTCYMEVQLLSAAVGDVLWWDGAQFEQKAYATSWVLGGSTRNVETLTIPTTGLSPSQGTIEFWVKPSSAALNTTKLADGSCLLSHDNTLANRWDVWLSHGGKAVGVYNGVVGRWLDASTPAFQPDTLHHVAVTYHSVNGTRLYVDGALVGTDATMTSMPTFSPQLYIGSFVSITAYISDSIFDDVRVSTISRTDADILASYNATKSFVPDQNTHTILHFDGNLLSHEEVKAVIMPNGNLYIRGSKIIG